MFRPRSTRLLVISLLLLVPIAGWTQSNDVIDRMLEAEIADLEDALYIVAIVSGNAEPNADLDSAVNAVDWNQYGIELNRSTSGISFGELSYLLLERLPLPRGLFYRLFPGPRYAARELRYAGIPARSYYPGTRLSGLEVLRLTQRAADRAGSN